MEMFSSTSYLCRVFEILQRRHNKTQKKTAQQTQKNQVVTLRIARFNHITRAVSLLLL